jgi:RES domain-containing protein
VTLTGYRIVKARLAKDAFSGEGARLYGGRWNNPGSPVIYIASTTSLAMLEMLVHMQSRELLLKYVIFPVTFDDSLVTDVDLNKLPSDWRASPASPAVQAIGDRWIASGASAVLRVPSVVVESEFNYMLNPQHADFGDIDVGKMQQIAFDSRLK